MLTWTPRQPDVYELHRIASGSIAVAVNVAVDRIVLSV